MSPGAHRSASAGAARGRRRAPRDPFRVGLVLLIVIAIAVYFGFTKHIPFTHGYQLKAVFPSAVNIRQSSPVRIAGVNVGKVTGIQHYAGSNAALVTIDLSNDALPIHADATLKIRPRIFLEGNFFVDMQPGSPSAHTLSSGATIPITQTADPVQIDQVLSALQYDTRAQLQEFLAGYGTGLTHVPTPAENANQVPEVQGLTGAEALNRATVASPAALRSSALVAQGFAGSQPHDLSQLIAGLDLVSRALARDEAALQGLIVNFDQTLGAFASQSSNLSRSIALLPSTLRSANRAFVTLSASLPPTRAFSLALIPGVRELPATIAAGEPWIPVTRTLLAPNALGGVATQLRAAAPALAATTAGQTTFNQQLDLSSRCIQKVLLPAGNVPIQDGSQTTGVENYKEFWYGLVGLAGESQNFDGNGAFVRILSPGGSLPLTSGTPRIIGQTPGGQALRGTAAIPPLGTRPRYPGSEPPYKPKVPCYTQALPNYNGPLANGPADGSSPGR